MSNDAPNKAVHPKRAEVRRTLLPFRRQRVGDSGGSEARDGKPYYVLISGLLLTAVLSAIMLLPVLPGQASFEANTPANVDIFSPTDARYESEVLTERARQAARLDPINDVWVQNAARVAEQRSILMGNLSVLQRARVDETMHPGVTNPSFNFNGITVTQDLLNVLLAMSDAEYNYWREEAVIKTFDALMREGRIASEADLQAVQAAVPNRVPVTLSEEPRVAAIAFVAPLLMVNMQLDAAETQARREAAAARVKPITQTVQRGEVITRQGELITPEAVEKMQRVGLLGRELSPLGIAGAVGIVGLLMLLLHLYLYRYAQPVWHRYKQLILFGLLIVVTVGVARVFLPGHDLLPFLLPLAAVSMLVSVLLNANLAVLTTAVLSILLGVVVNNGLTLELPVYYFIGGLTGIFTLTRIERVSTFARAGISIAVALFATILLMQVLMGHSPQWSDVGTAALAAGFNAGISTSITYAAFSLLGTLFGITTPLQLMELAHPDQPLLRQLMREAPGTYHHSLVVSNLAEHAAEMVGADPLLTRVCAYYHDIGKAARPYYFIDNQAGMSNVHDQMDPAQSANIIMEHVRDGVRMGQKGKLPKRVIDAIPQHHGTMLIKYFYHKALQSDLRTDESQYRYPGPKPQTKENAILMLADGVEATVRAMAQSGALDKIALENSDASESPGLYKDDASLPDDALATVVHKVISERIEDGQLDECDLTVRDIVRIQEAFVSMLKGIYHPRVQYPEKPTGEEGKAKDEAAFPVAAASNIIPMPLSAGRAAIPTHGAITAPMTPDEERLREQRAKSISQ